MIGTTLIAADWNRLTLTTRGGEIERALKPFSLKPLALGPPLDDLEQRIGLVLDGLELPRTRISRISAEHAFGHLADRDEDEREEYVSGLLSIVARPLTRPVAVLLHEMFFTDVAAECGHRQSLGPILGVFAQELAATKSDDVEMRLARTLQAVPAGLMATVFHLATAVAYDLTSEQTARELARLFLDGNFPVGIQHDGAFVVLVK